MKNDDFFRCEDSSNAQSLAGYKYVTDQDIVNSASHIDVDIAKIDIFIGNGARHFPESEETLFQTAFDIYKLGRDSTEIGWLGNMARDPNRDVVPTFGSFQRYFNTDKHYADTIIVRAFPYQLPPSHMVFMLNSSRPVFFSGKRVSKERRV